MTKATTRRFFFGGTILFSAVFIGLTVQTHTTISRRTHADRLTPEVVSGMHVWQKYNCENCHTLMGEGAYYAPDLTQIVAQRGTAYLSQFLLDPSRFYDADRDGRLMPTLGLSPDEADRVLAFLEWVGHIDTNGWPPRPILVSSVALRGQPLGAAAAAGGAAAGKALFDGIGGCAACHSTEPGVVRVGPSLAGIARRAAERIREPGYGGSARNAREYIRESIVSPNAYVVGKQFVTPDGLSFMPSTYAASLPPDQVRDLVDYLMTLE